MPSQYWEALLDGGAPLQTNPGTALSTATTATISPQLPGTKDFTLPTPWWEVGKLVRVKARGIVSSGGTTSNLTVFLAAGSGPTTLASTAAIALGTGSLANMPWRLEALIRCIALGSSGNTLETQGELMWETSATPAFGTANTGIAPLADTSAALDTTSAMPILLRATLSAAFGSITCQQFTLESLN